MNLSQLETSGLTWARRADLGPLGQTTIFGTINILPMRVKCKKNCFEVRKDSDIFESKVIANDCAEAEEMFMIVNVLLEDLDGWVKLKQRVLPPAPPRLPKAY